MLNWLGGAGLIRGVCRMALCLGVMLAGCSISQGRTEPEPAGSEETETAADSGSQAGDQPGAPPPTGPVRPSGGDTGRRPDVPALSVADARADESDGSLVFPVTLSAAADTTVSVTYATEDGTATAGDDYVAAGGTLTFAARSTSQQVEIELLVDDVDEGVETFTLRLSNPRGATLQDAEATGEIGMIDTVAPELVSLELRDGDSAELAPYPAFSSGVLHYALTCENPTSLQITATARHSDATLTLLRADPSANVVAAGTLTAHVTVDRNADIAIEVSAGDQTATYVVHCLPDDLLSIEFLESRPGVSDGLLLVTPQWTIGPSRYVAMVDNNGVPRFHRRFNAARNFRRHPDGRYSVQWGGVVFVYDSRMETRVTVRPQPPIDHVDAHDFLISDDGNLIFMAYVPAMRNSCEFEGCDPATGTVIEVRDSVIQETTPQGEKVFEWNSADHLNLRDCAAERENYAHLNSLYLAADGDLVASFRFCNTVVRIDRSSGDGLEWQVGGTAVRHDTTAHLAIVGDDDGKNEFCGQHSATLPEPDRLLLLDNGNYCNGVRKDRDQFSRVVEYKLVNTETTKEAVFQRQFILPSTHGYARSSGSVNELSNGNWLIAWGRLGGGTANYDERWTITEYDPANGVAVLHLNMHSIPNEHHGYSYRAYRESESNIEIPLNLP